MVALQQLDDLGAVDALDARPCWARRGLWPPRRWCAWRGAARVTLGAILLGASVVLVPAGVASADAQELLIHLGRGDPRAIVEQGQQIAADQDVLLERHGSGLRHDHLGVAAHGVEPIAELLGVRDGCRQ